MSLVIGRSGLLRFEDQTMGKSCGIPFTPSFQRGISIFSLGLPVLEEQ